MWGRWGEVAAAAAEEALCLPFSYGRNPFITVGRAANIPSSKVMKLLGNSLDKNSS
jgi:hypothetical protein